MSRSLIVMLMFALISIFGAFYGCSDHSAGAGLFVREKCTECHTIKGKGGAVGPNLTTVGNRRSRDYIVQQIKNPSSHNPNTAMPSFKDRLSEQEINTLADYLSNLR